MNRYIASIYKTTFFLIAFVLVMLLPGNQISGQANSYIQFQGKITRTTDGTNARTTEASCINNAGADTCDFRINLYDQVTSGNLLFQEVHENIEIGDYFGIFNIQINSVCESWVALGSPPAGCTASPTVDGIDWSASPVVYIELEFDDDGNGDFTASEIFSRKLYSATPYALYADTTNTINGFDSDDFVQVQPGSAQAITGSSSDAIISINETGAATPAFLELQQGGTTQFQIANDGSVSIGDGTDAFLDIKAATTTSAQINLSSGVAPSSPVDGDLWFDGTDFKFYDGSSTTDLGNLAPGSLFTDGGDVTYLTSTTDDFAIGGTDISNSVFGIDISLGDFYYGSNGLVDPTFIFENSSSDTGSLGFNSNDAFEFNNSTNSIKVGIKTATPETELDVVGDIQVSGDILAATADSSDIGTALKPFNNVYVANTNTNATFDANTILASSILAQSPYVESIGYEVTVESTNNVGRWLDMAINKDGNPVLAYRDETNTRLGVTVCGTVDCSYGNTTTFYTSSGDDGDFGVSVAISAENLPIISYHETSGQDWQLALCQNPECSTALLQALDNSTAGQYSDIIVAPDGNPVLFSQHGLNDRLEVRPCTDISCTAYGANVSLDDSTTNVGVTPEAVIGLNGLPVVAYHDETNGNLKLLRCLIPGCTTATVSTILTGTDVGEWADITLGREGYPMIAHHDASAGDVLLTICKNQACSIYDNISINESSDVIGDLGIGISTKLDGSAVISYYNTTNESFNIYECYDVLCTSGENHEFRSDSTDTGQYSSIIRVPGTAETFVASYYDAGGDDVELFYFNKTYSEGETLGSSSTYFEAVYTANLYSKSASISNFDVAEEYVAVDDTLEAGDIVAFSDEDSNVLNIEKSNRVNDSRVIGVISTEPGLYLKNWEENNEKSRPVALVGRVPVKVTDENGPIERGDYIVSSSTPGYGMKATSGGTIVGRAMEDFNPSELDEDDSFLVQQFLTEERDAAYEIIEEYRSQLVSEILSESEKENLQSEVEEYLTKVEKLTGSIDEVQRNVSTGRIMMFVNLTEVDDELFGKNMYDAFDSEEDIEALSSLEGFINLSGNNISISAEDIILKTDVGIEGDLNIDGILTANNAEFDTLISKVNLNLPQDKKGSFTLNVGEQEKFIENSKVSEDSKIFLTSIKSDLQIAVTEKEEAKGFLVKTKNKAETDVQIQYVIID